MCLKQDIIGTVANWMMAFQFKKVTHNLRNNISKTQDGKAPPHLITSPPIFFNSFFSLWNDGKKKIFLQRKLSHCFMVTNASKQKTGTTIMRYFSVTVGRSLSPLLFQTFGLFVRKCVNILLFLHFLTGYQRVNGMKHQERVSPSYFIFSLFLFEIPLRPKLMQTYIFILHKKAVSNYNPHISTGQVSSQQFLLLK